MGRILAHSPLGKRCSDKQGSRNGLPATLTASLTIYDVEMVRIGFHI
jgi:hypothetical protein